MSVIIPNTPPPIAEPITKAASGIKPIPFFLLLCIHVSILQNKTAFIKKYNKPFLFLLN
jgi:hypothetical protein